MSASLRRSLPRVAALCGATLLLLAGVVFVRSERMLSHRHVPPAVGAPCAESEALTRATPATVARGRHMVFAVAQCAFCHGADLGGATVGDDPWIGRVDATNLTLGGGRRTFCDWDRAIRYGARADGRSMLLMPSRHYGPLSEDDVVAIVAFLRTVPPVEREIAPRRIGPLSRLVLASGLANDVFSALDEDGVPIRLESRPKVDRVGAARPGGDSLVDVGLCRVCHKPDLSGGLHPLALPDEPVPPALMGEGAMVGWTLDDFVQAMRAGVTPEGRVLDPRYMPWPGYAGMTDLELRLLWQSLRGSTSPAAPSPPSTSVVHRP